MSLEDFQLIDNEPIEKSIIKRDFIKVYHQQGAQLIDPDQNIEFIFGENNNYHQVGNSYLQFDITVRKADNNNFNNDNAVNEAIRVVNNAFVHCFKKGVIQTTGGMELENIKFLGQVSTIMRALTSKDGDLLSHFDNIDESQAGNNNTTLKQMLINNHTEAANQGTIKGQLLLEDILGFCKTFKKITKNLGFHITLKTNDLQNIIFTTLANDINVTINSLYLFVPILTPNSETQVLFKESIKNNYTLTFDSCYTERKIFTDGGEFQVHIASSQSTNSPKYLIASHQTEDRLGTANKANNVSTFDHVDVKKYFVEIDDYRYPKESVLTNFTENDYLDQYRDIKSFYQEYVGEQLMNPFISYTDMKNKYPIQVIDLRHQIDQLSPKKIQLFEEYKNDPVYANKRLYVILIRHQQIEMISDGNKIIKVKVI